MTKEKSPIEKKFVVLRSTTSYSTLHNTIVDLLRSSHPSQVPYIRDSIARILQGSYNKEISIAKENPKALQAVDQKYGTLRVLVRKLTTPRPSSNQLASLAGQRKWGSPLVLGTAVLTLGGAFYLYTKYKNKENPSTTPKAATPTSGFQKTLKAIQKYKLISQLDFNSNFLEDYESIMKGKVKKVARKKPYSKSDAWAKEEGDLMKEIDSSFKSITTTKSSGYKIPELPESKELDPFSILGNAKPKKREVKRSKEISEVVDEPEVVFEEIEKPKPMRRRSTVSKPSSVERLTPIVKRTKRISKIRT